ncbi:TetR/AcrR family transcriptional regulator [Jatrophihabitans telluris]|uniref:TetR/AcrR family transcriptional regulator n=1 Tax=Jatrophihabitans telluris TaxID=2038343 RepID=A0ABY4QXH8_9ACTN|nr:TetR/AcrR family transcriptional regulator [Jatrophihabitans telluris]UQX88353.1 TetR/AcrR family transcriptional regulator [Jatrophihabitans telluris]
MKIAAVDGRSARWDAHRQSRRAELVQAAIRAVDKHGATVGMDQIAAEAGTSKAVFYRHFEDKADLYRAVGQEMASVWTANLGERIATHHDPRHMVSAGIDAYFQLLDKRPELYRFVARNPVLDAAGSERQVDYPAIVAARINDIIASAAASGGSSGAPGAGYDNPLAKPWGVAIVGLIQSAGDWWLDHPGELTRAELTASLTALLWDGLSTFERNPA